MFGNNNPFYKKIDLVYKIKVNLWILMLSISFVSFTRTILQ